MSWQFHELKQGLGHHKDQWDRLNAALFDSNPFFDGDFVDNLLKHFAEGHERLCVHESDGAVDGMLIVKSERWGRWSIFLSAQAQISPVLVKDARALPALLAALPGFTLSLLCLRQDPLYSPVTFPSAELVQFIMDHVRTISVQINGSFADYWDARPKNLRKTIRNRLHRLDKAGLSMKFAYLDDPAEMAGAVARYANLESKGWKEEAGTAVHAEDIQGQFYRGIMTDFGKRGKSSVYELYFGQTLVASRICVASDDMLIILKTTYDEDFAEYAPGRLLLHMLLQYEFDRRRFKHIEFYTNATIDQLAWATDDRMIKHVKLFRHQWMKSVYVLARQVWHSMRRKPSANASRQTTADHCHPIWQAPGFTDTAKPQ